MAHLLREEGAVAAVLLDALLVEAEERGVPLEDRLLAEGALTRPQRDRFVRTRDVLGRVCTSCEAPTFLLPGQGVGSKTCEHCGGRLRGGTSRRKRRLGTDHFVEDPAARPSRPSRRLEGRASRRLEARERLSRRFEEELSPVPAPRVTARGGGPRIEPPRATSRRPPVPPRPSQAMIRSGGEALAPRRTQAHPQGGRRTQAQRPPGEGSRATSRRTRAQGAKEGAKGDRSQPPAPGGAQRPTRHQERARPKAPRADGHEAPAEGRRFPEPKAPASGLSVDVARVVREAFEETRQDLITRVRREARAEVGRELERLGALELRERLGALEEASKGPQAERSGSGSRNSLPDFAALRERVEGQVAAALREAERRLDKRLADRDAESEERAGRRADAAFLAAAAGQGAAGRSLASAIERELSERGPELVLDSPLLAQRLVAAVEAYLAQEGATWLQSQPAIAELREGVEAAAGPGESEDLSSSVAALRAEARADSAQVEALARVGAGIQERLAALEAEAEAEAEPLPDPNLERRLRELEDGLVSERRARTKEIAELNQTQLLAAAEAAREAAREETSSWGPGEVEDRVRAEGELALGEVMTKVEGVGGRLAALERQLEARVRRQAGSQRVQHALRRSLRLGLVAWALLLIPLGIGAALYPTVYRAEIPLGPPTRDPYAGPVASLRTSLADPAVLEEVAAKVGLPPEAGWAEALAGLPETPGERLRVSLEPFGDPPRALYLRASGLGPVQAEAAASELALRLEAAAEAAGAPLSQIRAPSSEPQQRIWGWVLGAAGLLALLSFALAALRELRRKGFHDAKELGDMVDLPVLLCMGREERDS